MIRFGFKILAIVIIAIFALSCAKSDESRPNYDAETYDGTDYDGSTGKSGSLARFTIVGDNLYTVTETGLKYFDISNNEKPSFINHIDLGFGVETISPLDNKLFIGTQSGVYIYDISSPQNPSQMSYYSHLYSCDPVVANNNYAYATLRAGDACGWENQSTLEVIDISDLYNPEPLYSIAMSNPFGLALYNDNLFVCDNGLNLFKLDTVGYPTLSKTIDIDAFDLIVDENHLYVMGSNVITQYNFVNDTLHYLSEIKPEN